MTVVLYLYRLVKNLLRLIHPVTMYHERLRQSILGLGLQGRRTAISISTLISGL